MNHVAATCERWRLLCHILRLFLPSDLHEDFLECRVRDTAILYQGPQLSQLRRATFAEGTIVARAIILLDQREELAHLIVAWDRYGEYHWATTFIDKLASGSDLTHEVNNCSLVAGMRLWTLFRNVNQLVSTSGWSQVTTSTQLRRLLSKQESSLQLRPTRSTFAWKVSNSGSYVAASRN